MAEGPEKPQVRFPRQRGKRENRGGGRDAEAAAPSSSAVIPSQDEQPGQPRIPGRPEAKNLAAASASEAGPEGEPGPSESEADPGGGGGGQPEKPTAREYSRQVHEWLWQSYCGYLTWQSGLLAFPAYCSPPPQPLPQPQQLQPPSGPPGSGGPAHGPAAGPPLAPLGYYNPFYCLAAPPAANPAAPVTPAAPPAATAAAAPSPAPRAPNWQGSARLAPASRGGGVTAPRQQNENGRPAGREYAIPSLAHRFMAEMVDFFILFFIKATMVLTIMHVSGIKDISKFAMHYIIEEIDEDTSMEDLQKMMIVALIYRLLVCVYEIICIWGAGGATPGKFLLGLRVVTCDTSVLIAPSRVLVIPSSNVNITTSIIRALIKNFSIASFFPAFITLLFFQHNRTAYDIVAGTIVVKRNGVR
ncbi:protein FAM8A1 [Sarcophilus harrisii]|uniref:Family with sequence similarity 8 member A1 n=1 Tax=Sarcophilus harrisii TaxID=9305 RepID=A0A7N4PYC4_SARHA|nr:protein FAM8A1 [Sarcophilus harrisii]